MATEPFLVNVEKVNKMVVIGSDLYVGESDFGRGGGFEFRRKGLARELDRIVKEARRMHEINEEEESLDFGDHDFDNNYDEI